MNWLEIIELQSENSNLDLLISQLNKLNDEVAKDPGTRTIKTFSSAKFKSDFSIHLLHNSKEVEYGGSILGIRLASALREFGLVNHSIWVEMIQKNAEQT